MCSASLISRKEAVEQKLPRYFTGRPCLHGHISERYTRNKTCVDCGNVNANLAKQKNKSKYRAQFNDWQRANPERVKKYKDKYLSNAGGLRNLWTANYRAAKDERSPPWLTAGHLLEIESAYDYCAALRKCGLDYHVDHIVPLRGDNVSGLHVPWNLQVIPAAENVSKGNRFNG